MNYQLYDTHTIMSIKSSTFLQRHAPLILISITSVFAITAIIYPHQQQRSARITMHQNVLRDIEEEKEESELIRKQQQLKS